MERKLTVLLVEDDKKDCDELCAYAESTEDVKIQGVTDNSTDALQMVQSGLPDVVILDLELHLGGGNGLFFLDGLKKLELPLRPYILVTTNNSSIITLEQARRMGADFILAKYETEYSAQYVIEFLRMMKATIQSAASVSASTPEIESEDQRNHRRIQRIQRELDLIGISPKAIGYHYLTDAILETYLDPAPNLCRRLSEKYHKTDVSIERAIQNAINRAWRTSDPDDLLEHYTARIRSDKGVPTMMEFVHYYVNVLRLEDA
jgi:DNA-binding NarL/FixJ family response regulator/flavin-binding protein dodecin